MIDKSKIYKVLDVRNGDLIAEYFIEDDKALQVTKPVLCESGIKAVCKKFDDANAKMDEFHIYTDYGIPFENDTHTIIGTLFIGIKRKNNPT